MRQNTGQSANQTKTILRRKLRAERSKLSTFIRARHDEAIGQYLLQMINSKGARSIACYWPFDGEPNITPICKQLMADGCEMALPVISGNNDHEMRFHSWRQNSELGRNRYGIFEPLETAPMPLPDFDMLLMPLVGYDRCGNRLGMGSAYYDRCLESLRNSPTPLRVGIAYSLQEIDPVEKNMWDIPLHGLVNEHGWFTFDN